MTPEETFLQDIIAHPEDDTPRLIFADWLEEREDPRGQLIRLQCEMATSPKWTDDYFDLWDQEYFLMARHQGAWREELPSHYGIAWGDFHRGFVDSISSYGIEPFLNHGAEVCAAAPITQLRLISAASPSQNEDHLWQEMAQCPALEAIRHLDLSFQWLGDSEQQLFSSRYLEGLEGLDLTESRGSPEAIERLAQSCPGLRALVLDHFNLEEETPLALPQLQHLNLRRTFYPRGPLQYLLEKCHFPRLQKLHLGEGALSAPSAQQFAEFQGFPELRDLDLRACGLGDSGIQVLTNGPMLESVQRLILRGNEISDEGAMAIAQSPRLRNLTELDLTANCITEKGAIAILESPHLTGLQHLLLHFNQISDQFRRAIEKAPCIQALGVQFGSNAPRTWPYDPERRMPVRVGALYWLLPGRFHDGQDALIRPHQANGSHQAELLTFDHTGYLTDYEEIPLPAPDRQPEYDFQDYPLDQAAEHLYDLHRFSPATVEVLDFGTGDIETQWSFHAFYGGVDQLIEDPESARDALYEQEIADMESFCRQWIASEEFCMVWGDDRWAHSNGHFHSS